jgi:hypothetical protein
MDGDGDANPFDDADDEVEEGGPNALSAPKAETAGFSISSVDDFSLATSH